MQQRQKSDKNSNERQGMINPYYYYKKMIDMLMVTIPPQIQIKCIIRQILRNIIGLLNLNVLECSFMAQFLKNTLNIYDLKVQQSDENLPFDEKIQRIFLIIGYKIKQQITSYKQSIHKDICSVWKKFDKYYHDQWRNKKIEISIQSAAKMFENWHQNLQIPTGKDYNRMVDQAIIASKSYIIDKQNRLIQQQSQQLPSSRNNIKKKQTNKTKKINKRKHNQNIQSSKNNNSKSSQKKNKKHRKDKQSANQSGKDKQNIKQSRKRYKRNDILPAGFSSARLRSRRSSLGSKKSSSRTPSSQQLNRIFDSSSQLLFRRPSSKDEFRH